MIRAILVTAALLASSSVYAGQSSGTNFVGDDPGYALSPEDFAAIAHIPPPAPPPPSR